jgi:protease-4
MIFNPKNTLTKGVTRMPVSRGLRILGNIVLWVVVPLLIGWWLASIVFPKPAVGLIRLNMPIWFLSADLVMSQIEAAREDPGIKAVVVQIDSGGGEVVASQTLYLELQKLREEMPVVGSIDNVAASGAYYAAMATDPVYAKPSSIVGNVGVWAMAPPDLAVNDVVLASGPFKMTASNRAEFLRELEGIKQEFLAAVFTQREDRLKLTPAELSQGLAYSGREAARLGLIDQVGSQTEAIATAAELAGIENYEVVDLQARVFADFLANNPYFMESWYGQADPITGERNLPPGIYLLYDHQLRGAP